MSQNMSVDDADGAGLVSDCRLMLRYARKNSLVLSEDLAERIARLDAVLNQAALRPVSDISPALIAPGAYAGLPAEQDVRPGMLIQNVHSALTQVIAPATALTLQISEPPPGRSRLFGGLPLVVKAAALCAFASALLFMAGAVLKTQVPAPGATGALIEAFRTPMGNSLLHALHLLAGGALGASFYVLLRTQPFLRTRSYDPKYNAAYVARFITGVIAGVILAYTVGPSVYEGLSKFNGAEISPGLVAILGGYAAEAVELVLQRFVDILMTAVRGDNGSEAEAKAAQAHSAKVARIEAATGEILDAQDIQAARAAVLKLRSSLRS